MVSNPPLNCIFELCKYKLENVFYEIRQDNVNLARLSSLSSLTQSITSEKLYYTEESKPSSFKINIFELIEKLLQYNFDQSNDLLEKSYLNSTQEEVLDDVTMIASFIIKNNNNRKYFLMYASYDGGIFFINHEHEKSFLYILQNSLVQKSIRLHRDESSIEILSNIVKSELCTEKLYKGVIINKNTDNCFLKSFNSPASTYPILNIDSSNVKSLSQSNCESSKKYQLSKVSSSIKNEKIKKENEIDDKKTKTINIGRIEDFNLINLGIPTFHQSVCPNVLLDSFEKFGTTLKMINPTISDNQLSICKGLIFSKLEECINWKLGNIENTATVSDFTNNCNYNLDIDQFSASLSIKKLHPEYSKLSESEYFHTFYKKINNEVLKISLLRQMRVFINKRTHMITCTKAAKHFTFVPGLGCSKNDFIGVCDSDSTIDQLKITITVKEFKGKKEEFKTYLWQIRKKVSDWMLTESPDRTIQQNLFAANLANDCDGVEFPGGTMMPLLICLLVIREYPTSTNIYFETYGGKNRAQWSSVDTNFNNEYSATEHIKYANHLHDSNQYTSIGIMERFIGMLNLIVNDEKSIKGKVYIGIGCTIAPPNKHYMVCTKIKESDYENFNDIKSFFNKSVENKTIFLPLRNKQIQQFSILGKLCPMNILPTNFVEKFSYDKMTDSDIKTFKTQFYYPDIKNSLGELGTIKQSSLAGDLNLASVNISKSTQTSSETNIKILFQKRVFKFIEFARKSRQLWLDYGLCGRVEVTKAINMDYINNNKNAWFQNVLCDGINDVIKIKNESKLYDVKTISFLHDIIIDSYLAKSEIILQSAKSNSMSSSMLSEEMESFMDDLLISIKQHYSGRGTLRKDNKPLNQFPFLSFACSRPVKSKLSKLLNIVRTNILSSYVGPTWNDTTCWELFKKIIIKKIPEFDPTPMPEYLTIIKRSKHNLLSMLTSSIYKLCKHCNTIFHNDKNLQEKYKNHPCCISNYLSTGNTVNRKSSLVSIPSKEFDLILATLVNTLDCDQKKVYDIITSSKFNSMTYGMAGSGKSYLLKAIILTHIKNSSTNDEYVRLALTNVAANNISGLTIDSYICNYPDQNGNFTSLGDSLFNVTKHCAYLSSSHTNKYNSIKKNLKVLVIDELPSSFNSKAIENFSLLIKAIRNSNAPFGGVRINGFGCLYQVPPPKQLKSFFESDEYQKGDFIVNKLYQVKRQKEFEFAAALNDSINPTRLNNSCFSFLNNQCGSKIPLNEVKQLLDWLSIMLPMDLKNNSKYKSLMDICTYANHKIENTENMNRLQTLCCKDSDVDDCKPIIIVNTTYFQITQLDKLWTQSIIDKESKNENKTWRQYKGVLTIKNLDLNRSREIVSRKGNNHSLINRIQNLSKILPKYELLLKEGESVMFYKNKQFPDIQQNQRGIIKKINTNSVVIKPLSPNPDLIYSDIELFKEMFFFSESLYYANKNNEKVKFLKSKVFDIEFQQFPLMNGKFILYHQLQSLTIKEERLIFNNHAIFKPFEGLTYMIGSRTAIKEDLLFLFEVVPKDFEYRNLTLSYDNVFSNGNIATDNDEYLVLDKIDNNNNIMTKTINSSFSNSNSIMLASNGYYQNSFLKYNSLEKNQNIINNIENNLLESVDIRINKSVKDYIHNNGDNDNETNEKYLNENSICNLNSKKRKYSEELEEVRTKKFMKLNFNTEIHNQHMIKLKRKLSDNDLSVTNKIQKIEIKVEDNVENEAKKKKEKKKWNLNEEFEAARFFQLIGYSGFHKFVDWDVEKRNKNNLSKYLQITGNKDNFNSLVATIKKLKQFGITSDQLNEKLKYFIKKQIFSRIDSN